MQVTVRYLAGCPDRWAGGQRLRQPPDEADRADVSITLAAVETTADAAAVSFAGSPTVTVNGTDLFDTATPTGTLTCRIYSTSARLAGAPEVSDLVAALTKKVTS